MQYLIYFSFLSILVSCGSDTNFKTKIDDKIKFEETSLNRNKELTTFWINREYAICIGEGRPPCDCLSENEFIMLLFVEKSRKLLIESSIFFWGQETTIETDYIRKNSREYYIENQYNNLDSMTITIDEKLLLSVKGKKIQFEKYLWHDSLVSNSDLILKIRGRKSLFNSGSLLNYSIESDTPFFSFRKLEYLIHSNKASIGCSDDFNLNHLIIEGDTNQYFYLEFENDKVIFYKEINPSRGKRPEKNELLKQALYRKNNLI